jgi:peptidoglycan hydrolase CwlO-like protein
MHQGKKIRNLMVMLLTFAVLTVSVTGQASGEVGPITDLEDKLGSISEKEKAVLNELFTLEQEIDSLEQEEGRINGDMEALQKQIAALGKKIDEKQQDYDMQLEILKKVLVQYQRGGPASYLEILLNADSLSEFIKSLNIIKDISHNINELLSSLETDKKVLKEEKSQLDDKNVLLEQKKNELAQNLRDKQKVQQAKEDYLASLKEDRKFYEDQLNNVKQVWEDCRSLFGTMVNEITDIIGSGYFTMEDLNLEYGIFTVQGCLKEETFNRILSEKSSLPQTILHFNEKQVVIEVPEKHLILNGNFIIDGESAIRFEVESGTFYDMPLVASAIEELFQNGPLMIDFKSIAGDMVIIDFKINEVESKAGTLNFVIMPQF